MSCSVTIDFESLEDKQVTIREGDSLAQIRVPIEELNKVIEAKLKGEASGDCGPQGGSKGTLLSL